MLVTETTITNRTFYMLTVQHSIINWLTVKNHSFIEFFCQLWWSETSSESCAHQYTCHAKPYQFERDCLVIVRVILSKTTLSILLFIFKLFLLLGLLHPVIVQSESYQITSEQTCMHRWAGMGQYDYHGTQWGTGGTRGLLGWVVVVSSWD